MILDTTSWKSSDPEKQELRIKVANFARYLKIQKDKNSKLQREISNWKKQHRGSQIENEKLNEEINSLLEKISKIERQRDKYKALLFKKNSKSISVPTHLDPEIKRQLILAKTKRGAKLGHTANFRNKVNSLDIDETKRIFLCKCPDCGRPLNRGKSTENHLIEDIPLETVKTIVDLYQIERQWCSNCHKEVKAQPQFVIPKSRFGINTLTYILVLRYSTGLTIEKIRKILLDTYQIKISKGGIINQLKLAKEYLQNDYDKILEAVRTSPVKHADETSWRINGINSWVWAFLTKDNIYLTIEEGRGKGVPTEKLKGSTQEDVLIRDDYAGYKNLPMNHQSCWAHLLKEARFEVESKNSSREMKNLQNKLRDIFSVLKTETESEFDQNKRSSVYMKMKKKIDNIINSQLASPDSKRIQTRIKNQGGNLLTALKYPDVPLTNNLAERSLRPLVITRKLTGGSRSHDGAQTHATNISIIQTILAQNKPLIPTLKEYLYQGSTGDG